MRSKKYKAFYIPGKLITMTPFERREPPLDLAIGARQPSGSGWMFASYIDVFCPDCIARLDAGEHLRPDEVIPANFKFHYNLTVGDRVSAILEE